MLVARCPTRLTGRFFPYSLPKRSPSCVITAVRLPVNRRVQTHSRAVGTPLEMIDRLLMDPPPHLPPLPPPASRSLSTRRRCAEIKPSQFPLNCVPQLEPPGQGVRCWKRPATVEHDPTFPLYPSPGCYLETTEALKDAGKL